MKILVSIQDRSKPEGLMGYKIVAHYTFYGIPLRIMLRRAFNKFFKEYPEELNNKNLVARMDLPAGAEMSAYQYWHPLQ